MNCYTRCTFCLRKLININAVHKPIISTLSMYFTSKEGKNEDRHLIKHIHVLSLPLTSLLCR